MKHNGAGTTLYVESSFIKLENLGTIAYLGKNINSSVEEKKQ